LIIYGVTAKVSIGQLFIGAIIPGILLTLFFSIVVLVYLKFNPINFEKLEELEYKEKEKINLEQVLSLIASIFIDIAVIGGISSGFFTSTEDGAIGSAIAFILAVILKKVN